jgi:tetratricopeptide (TPR) repeat protein
MKTKILLLVSVAAGIAVFGCASTGSSGQIKTNLDGFTPGEKPTTLVYEYDAKTQPTYNKDGSITVLTTKNVQIRILPMTNTRGRGALNRSTEEFDKLIRQYEAEIKTNPQNYDTYIMLAGLYIDRGKPGDADMAVKYGDQALAVSKDNAAALANALYVRAIAYSEKDDKASRAKALEDLEQVLKTNLQSMKGAYYIMGMIYYKEEKIDEAITAFEKVKNMDPEFVDTNEILDVLYSKKK